MLFHILEHLANAGLPCFDELRMFLFSDVNDVLLKLEELVPVESYTL